MSNRFTDDHYSITPNHSPTVAYATPKVLTAAGSPTSKSSAESRSPSASAWVNQVQLALAIMRPALLKQLLINAEPSLMADHRLGQITLKLEVPISSQATADGILCFEVISCRLANPKTMPPFAPMTSPFHHHRAMVNQIRSETKLQNLGLNLTLTEAIARLQYAAFSSPDIQRILHLPYHGWHRSWWEMVDPANEFSLPFQRLMRSRRYADGTITLQYKDQFAYLPPPCFHSHSETALIHIQRPGAQFAPTLAHINHSRQTLGLTHALLLYHHLSDAEYQGFRHQGVSLYSWERDRPIATLPAVSVDCGRCHQSCCPMQGKAHSPVTACDQFRVEPF